MHILIHAHAVQGFSLKQVRSSTVRAMVCAVVCPMSCPVVCTMLCSMACSIVCSIVCSVICTMVCSIVCSELCAMLSPYSCPSPTLLTRTFSPRAGARAQRQAAIYLSGNENEHTVENVGLGARFLDPLIYVMKLNFELNSSCCTHGGFSCGPGF